MKLINKYMYSKFKINECKNENEDLFPSEFN